MHLTSLRLDQFRAYAHLEFDLPAGGLLLHGPNASGKTSILEAIYLLATTRSSRASADREMIRWESGAEFGVAPFARVTGKLVRGDGPVEIEIVLNTELASTPGAAGPGEGARVGRKRIKLNGSARRALDVVGTLKVVLFTPHDIELIGGPPARRRRHLDITISQIDNHYPRQLALYNRILEQRNGLLRQFAREGRDPHARDVEQELSYWSEELVRLGAYIVARRDYLLARLDQLARDRFAGLTATGSELVLEYRSTVTWYGARGRGGAGAPVDQEGAIARDFREQLDRQRHVEFRRGMSLVGPHRDDYAFLLGGHELDAYGSRGQQRLAALAVKLAEIDLIEQESGEAPVLLLDDASAELDPDHRHFVTDAIERGNLQVIVTATDLGHLAPELLPRLARREVRDGVLSPATG